MSRSKTWTHAELVDAFDRAARHAAQFGLKPDDEAGYALAWLRGYLKIENDIGETSFDQLKQTL